MRIDIIIAYVPRYRFGHEMDFVPPLTGIHLAALIPLKHQVRVFHQQIEPLDFDTDADLIAISFSSGFANEACRVAAEFKRRKKTVIGGGPHVSFSEEPCIGVFDSVISGEAESVLSAVIEDAEKGTLQPRYAGSPTPMAGFPTPRYDLLSERFFIKKVVQATRGCPFSCSFCTVPVISPGFRKRPVDEVMRDVRYDRFRHWWQRKIVWFWDDNLTIDREYIRELLDLMKTEGRWWLTQASIDVARDRDLLKRMKESGCIGIFLGLETFGQQSIIDARKHQNRVSDYKAAVKNLHDHGIAVMTGLITGFDHDTPESIFEMSAALMDLGVDVPFISIMTPFPGTGIRSYLESEGRILKERGWEYYNGYNVTFKPLNMSPEELLKAHRRVWRKAFSVWNSLTRIIRSMFYLNLGAFLLTLSMNGLYGLKRFRGNLPVDMDGSSRESLQEAVP